MSQYRNALMNWLIDGIAPKGWTPFPSSHVPEILSPSGNNDSHPSNSSAHEDGGSHAPSDPSHGGGYRPYDRGNDDYYDPRRREDPSRYANQGDDYKAPAQAGPQNHGGGAAKPAPQNKPSVNNPAFPAKLNPPPAPQGPSSFLLKKLPGQK